MGEKRIKKQSYTEASFWKNFSHNIDIKKKGHDDFVEKQLKKTLQYLIVLLCALCVSLFITGTVMKKYHPVIVSGNSMYPTLEDGNILVSTTEFTYNSLDIGDIIVFQKGKQMIKRIIAKQNDTVWISNGIVYVNGEKSPYQYEKIEDAGMFSEPVEIGENELFCLGDNRNHSNDCRNYGTVEINEVRFKIIKKAF